MKKDVSGIIICTFLSLYFALANTWDYTGNLSGDDFYRRLFVYFFIAEIIVLILFHKLEHIKLNFKPKKIKKKEFLAYFLIILIPFFYMIVSFYPALGEIDTYMIVEGNDAGYFSNWHPVIYQVFFIWIPRIFSKNLYFLIVPQVLFEIAVLLYMCVFLRKNFLDYKSTIIILLLIILNPMFLKLSIFVGKDAIYSYFLLFLTMNLIYIVKSDGEWLKSKKNKIFFIISSIGVLTIRHNGIIPFILAFVCLIITFPKFRYFIYASLTTILLIFMFLTTFVYEQFNIGEIGGKREMMGMVFNNLSYYYKNAYLSNSEYDVIFKLYPQYVWEGLYHPRNFNLIKNYDIADYECISYYCQVDFRTRIDDNFDAIIGTWFEISKRNPDLFLKSFLNVSSPIWEIKRDVSGYEYWWQNYDEVKGFNLALRNIYNEYYNFISQGPLRVFALGIGESLFIIVFAAFLVVKKTGFKLKQLLPFLPVLINSCVMMLLITGEEYRFAFSQVTCVIPLVIYALSVEHKKKLFE